MISLISSLISQKFPSIDKGLTAKMKPVVSDDLVHDTTTASLVQLASHVFFAAHTPSKL